MSNSKLEQEYQPLKWEFLMSFLNEEMYFNFNAIPYAYESPRLCDVYMILNSLLYKWPLMHPET
jgi:hypothetical protein